MRLSDHADLVVFDFDGTLCDSVDVKTEAFYELYLEEAGDDFAARVRDDHLAHVGISRFDKIRRYEAWLGREGSAARVDEAATRFGAIVVERVIAAPLIPGAAAFLSRHSHDLPLCVASATPTDELRHIVAAKGLADSFHCVAGSPVGKGEILAGFVDRFGAAPGRTVMVGDQRSDRAAAAEVRTAFVGVGPAGRPGLFPPGDVVIPDLSDLAAAIRRVVATPG